MREMFSDYNGVEILFLICAIVGGFFVVVKFIMQFMGMDHDAHTEIGMGHDIDGHHADSDLGFKMLSLHGITSFLMMFGLVGLAFYRQSSVGILISMLGASVAGLASVWVIGKLFFLAAKLKSSGTIAIDSTVGAQGKVYMAIPENSTGRVLIKVHNSLREYDAVSNDSKAINTGIPIRVVWVDGNVLVVEKI
jgi:membrane protein implicated in regulation of membrane protease activity